MHVASAATRSSPMDVAALSRALPESRLQSASNLSIGVTWYMDPICNTSCEKVTKASIVCRRLLSFSSSPRDRATHAHLQPNCPGGVRHYIANALHGLRVTRSLTSTGSLERLAPESLPVPLIQGVPCVESPNQAGGDSRIRRNPTPRGLQAARLAYIARDRQGPRTPPCVRTRHLMCHLCSADFRGTRRRVFAHTANEPAVRL